VDGLGGAGSIAKETIAEIEALIQAQISGTNCPHLFSIPDAAA